MTPPAVLDLVARFEEIVGAPFRLQESQHFALTSLACEIREEIAAEADRRGDEHAKIVRNTNQAAVLHTFASWVRSLNGTAQQEQKP